MTVRHLSLLDLVGQNTTTPATASAADWQHFQDLLKTALDQNASADATKPAAPDRAVTRAAIAQAAGNQAVQAENSAEATARQASAAQTNAAHASAAQADANRNDAAQAETAQARTDQADAVQARSAAARRVEKRNAARADAASADQAATTPDAAAAPPDPAAAVTADGAPVDATAANSSSSQTPPAAAGQDNAPPSDPSSASTSGTDAGAATAAPLPDQTVMIPQDAATPAAPQPSQQTPATDAAPKDATQSAAGDTAATDASASAGTAAAATIIAALVPAPPPPPVAVAVAAGGAHSTVAPDPVATGSLADLLSSTTDPGKGDHLAAGSAAPSKAGTNTTDTAAADPASALFGAGGDAAASLAAGVAPTPATQGGNQSGGQGSGQKQEHSSSAAAAAQDRTSRSGDSQAAPAAQQPIAPAAIVVQPPVTPAASLATALTGAGAARSESAVAPDAGTDADGTTPPLGFADRTSAANLTPLRLSETPGAAASPYAPTQAPLPVEQVALAIGRLTNGARSFSMQLNPEHLGAVDVRMEVDSKGKTKVAITAERPETLALLKLDSHHLVKALQDSGVSADQASLSFSLREQGSNAASDRRSGNGQSGRNAGRTSADDTQDSEAVPVRMSLSRHLYDIHA